MKSEIKNDWTRSWHSHSNDDWNDRVLHLKPVYTKVLLFTRWTLSKLKPAHDSRRRGVEGEGMSGCTLHLDDGTTGHTPTLGGLLCTVLRLLHRALWDTVSSGGTTVLECGQGCEVRWLLVIFLTFLTEFNQWFYYCEFYWVVIVFDVRKVSPLCWCLVLLTCWTLSTGRCSFFVREESYLTFLTLKVCRVQKVALWTLAAIVSDLEGMIFKSDLISKLVSPSLCLCPIKFCTVKRTRD